MPARGVFTVSGTPQIVQRTTTAVRRSPGDLIKAALAARWCFFDAAHFSRVFRQHYGYPPSRTRS